MKRFLSISFICVAVAVILSMHASPHHHHGVIVCVESHSCDSGSCDRQHEHRHEAENTHDPGSCIAEVEYTNQLGRSTGFAYSSDNDRNQHLFPIISLCADLITAYAKPESGNDHGEYLIHYISIDPRGGNSLRAPPAFLC